MTEQGWLLESRLSGHPIWFRIAACNNKKWDFTTDSNTAIRFSRQKDAEDMLTFLQGLSVLDSEWKVTGHEWCDYQARPAAVFTELCQ